jgi:Na+-transporting NADH:ubiquinone oxidoreductase subunit NqrD
VTDVVDARSIALMNGNQGVQIVLTPYHYNLCQRSLNVLRITTNCSLRGASEALVQDEQPVADAIEAQAFKFVLPISTYFISILSRYSNLSKFEN